MSPYYTDDRTPTTDEVRSIVGLHAAFESEADAEAVARAYDGFDRWLTEHVRHAMAAAWDQGWAQGHIDCDHDGDTDNPYRTEGNE